MQNSKLNFKVIKKDKNNLVSHHSESMSLPTLIKHLALAGMFEARAVDKISSVIAQIFSHWRRIYDGELETGRFGELPSSYSEPDLQSEFSRIIARALMDYLLKRYEGVEYTVNYEAVLKTKKFLLSGPRGDLVGFANGSIKFVIESKGRTGTVSDVFMDKLKRISRRWKISGPNIVIGVTQKIYSGIVVKYYDPVREQTKISEEQYFQLMTDYYASFLDLFDIAEAEGFLEKNKKLFKVPLISLLGNFDKNDKYFLAFKQLNPKLVISRKVLKCLKVNNLPKPVKRFSSGTLFIDSDGVGIEISKIEN